MLLARSLILKRLLVHQGIALPGRHVGILVPPSAGGVLANAAVTLARAISVNLNYSVSSRTLNECLAQAEIRHVLTSRRVMERFDLRIDARLVFLEDFKDQVRWWDKLSGLMAAYLLPVPLLERYLQLKQVDKDDVMTVVFTSGSSGEPKGVMLTHENIASNVKAIDQVVQLRRDDTILGILPFFHSFGYTVTLWSVLGLDVRGAYHFSPLDAHQVGKLCRQHRCTLLLSTPTFLRSFIKRCNRDDFASLEVIVTGAERLPPAVADAFEERFGIRPVEGYGTTELSPLVSANVPSGRSRGAGVDCREGTVGRPVPDVRAKVVHPETMQDLPAGESGLLLIKGPNVMKGYLKQPEKTAEVIRDGWYVTGDIARIDEEGFITITGRQSRFSKIGGEMVPHIRIEEEINQILGGDDHGEIKAVVTAVTDPRKGERLVVVHKQPGILPDEICRRLADGGFPNLWIPAEESFHEVSEIPLLGSGKVDLKEVKRIAEEVFGPAGRS
jgi:acyl-[acyl-carrier-protein]-phospholipid O-acyltransferase/long-chain-fatty-acid--[acyl-carrier-protein] ligase